MQDCHGLQPKVDLTWYECNHFLLYVFNLLGHIF